VENNPGIGLGKCTQLSFYQLSSCGAEFFYSPIQHSFDSPIQHKIPYQIRSTSIPSTLYLITPHLTHSLGASS